MFPLISSTKIPKYSKIAFYVQVPLPMNKTSRQSRTLGFSSSPSRTQKKDPGDWRFTGLETVRKTERVEKMVHDLVHAKMDQNVRFTKLQQLLSFTQTLDQSVFVC